LVKIARDSGGFDHGFSGLYGNAEDIFQGSLLVQPESGVLPNPQNLLAARHVPTLALQLGRQPGGSTLGVRCDTRFAHRLNEWPDNRRRLGRFDEAFSSVSLSDRGKLVKRSLNVSIQQAIQVSDGFEIETSSRGNTEPKGNSTVTSAIDQVRLSHNFLRLRTTQRCIQRGHVQCTFD
jgi:hypothetical protein